MMEVLDHSYRPLPLLYLSFSSIWFFFSCFWMLNTYTKPHFQINNLQWTLALVPLIKTLKLTLSFIFWYWCYNLEKCSLWMSFGVYVTGVMFKTMCLVSFILISYGYCIMCERLTTSERRNIATLASLFYLSLVAYKASVPYFSVVLLLNYVITFYVIFHHTSHNLMLLREHLRLIEEHHFLHSSDHPLYTKYTMFKKFQGAMQIVAIAEAVLHINLDESSENYWIRLLVREWAQLCIFLFIGWTFRSQELTPMFSVMPTQKFKTTVPPIYSIEMDAATFKDFSSHEWHIGVATTLRNENSKEPGIVIIQQPHANRPTTQVHSLEKPF